MAAAAAAAAALAASEGRGRPVLQPVPFHQQPPEQQKEIQEIEDEEEEKEKNGDCPVLPSAFHQQPLPLPAGGGVIQGSSQLMD